MEIKTLPKIHVYAYLICRAWYNGSYTMATKPIKYLELHYTMTQFFIIFLRQAAVCFLLQYLRTFPKIGFG